MSTKASSSVASLPALKETLEKMVTALQQELHKVDSEWIQMCSIAVEQQRAANQSTIRSDVTFDRGVTIAELDDPEVINKIELDLSCL